MALNHQKQTIMKQKSSEHNLSKQNWSLSTTLIIWDIIDYAEKPVVKYSTLIQKYDFLENILSTQTDNQWLPLDTIEYIIIVRLIYEAYQVSDFYSLDTFCDRYIQLDKSVSDKYHEDPPILTKSKNSPMNRIHFDAYIIVKLYKLISTFNKLKWTIREWKKAQSTLALLEKNSSAVSIQSSQDLLKNSAVQNSEVNFILANKKTENVTSVNPQFPYYLSEDQFQALFSNLDIKQSLVKGNCFELNMLYALTKNISFIKDDLRRNIKINKKEYHVRIPFYTWKWEVVKPVRRREIVKKIIHSRGAKGINLLEQAGEKSQIMAEKLSTSSGLWGKRKWYWDWWSWFEYTEALLGEDRIYSLWSYTWNRLNPTFQNIKNIYEVFSYAQKNNIICELGRVYEGKWNHACLLDHITTDWIITVINPHDTSKSETYDLIEFVSCFKTANFYQILPFQPTRETFDI